MLAIGDRVEIIGRRGDPNKYGGIVQVDSGVTPDGQPGPGQLPSRGREPSYSVKLNNGEVMHHLQEQQLRKL